MQYRVHPRGCLQLEADTEQRKKFEITRAIPVRIKDAVGGNYNATTRDLETIYGLLKRVQIVAVILNKKYAPAQQTGEKGTKSRLHLDLDDGTGIMAATWFGVDEDEASNYEIGDIIITLLRPGEYKSVINFSVDGIRKVTNIADELHHRAIILKKLKQLADAGKPLVLQGGGRITSTPDDASRFFTTSKNAKPVDMAGIEQPVQVNVARTQQEQFTSRSGVTATGMDDEGGAVGVEDEPVDGIEKEPVDDDAGSIPSTEHDMDEDVVKRIILDTIMQPEYEAGITVDALVKSTGMDRNLLARTLKIMENERTVAQHPSKPGTYTVP